MTIGSETSGEEEEGNGPYFGVMEEIVAELEADRRRVERIKGIEPIDVVADQPRPVEGDYCKVIKKVPHLVHLCTRKFSSNDIIVDHIHSKRAYLTLVHCNTLLTCTIHSLSMLLHHHLNLEPLEQNLNQHHHRNHQLEETSDKPSKDILNIKTDKMFTFFPSNEAKKTQVHFFFFPATGLSFLLFSSPLQ